MSNELLPLDCITEKDRQRAREYYARRFLYNKYTPEELLVWHRVDLYEALDLDGIRFKSISEDVLKHAVRRAASLYHPARNSDKNEAFILVKTAEKVFSTPKYKKIYDSVSLDESVPDDREYALEEFLDAFAPVFERNGHFSESQPVPSIRDDVDTFYRFWNNFRTTRLYEDPEDVFEQRGSSRRYNAEQKKEAIQKKREADARRIVSLVKLAYSRDPRIKRHRPAAATVSWNEEELKSLQKFNMIMGKHKDKYTEIAKKLNHLYMGGRSANDVRSKLDLLKKR